MVTKDEQPNSLGWDEFGWTPLAAKYAPLVTRLAIRNAIEGKPLYYGDVAAAIKAKFNHRVSPQWIGHPAGLIAKRIEALRNTTGHPIPPLNIIISNRATDVAGVGGDEFIRTYLGMTKAQYRKEDAAEIRRQIRDIVYDYGAKKWAWVAKELGVAMPPFPKGKPEDDDTPIDLPPVPTGSRPEGKQHKALKAYVACHPELVRSQGAFPVGKNEVLISSGDRLDVLFQKGKRKLAVEVKPEGASESEMARGVFQCIKYRAVLRAHQAARLEPQMADAMLVIMKDPTHTLRRLMRRLDVAWIVVTRSQLEGHGKRKS